MYRVGELNEGVHLTGICSVRELTEFGGEGKLEGIIELGS